ncbi:MAG: O-methyltransferase [Chloroflexi bacterium]|nr:O-methyltransferase [Chloroflexota bacterium]
MKADRNWLPDATDVDWIESLGRPVHPALAALEAAAAPGHVPIVDRESGRVLGVLAAGRRHIVEVGTAIGYSTLWMALGQPADGRIVTIDPDRSRTDVARAAWRQAGIPDDQVAVVNAPALDAFAAGLPELAGPFDLAFIDALKEEYGAYLDAILPRLEPGALLVADNILWSGRTSGSRPSRPGDGSDELRAFSARVLADERFSGTILPLGDGLLVATYRP